MSESGIGIHTVREYWNSHPLLSHEFNLEGGDEFFRALDIAKRTDSDKFALPYWEFDAFSGRDVLDIGCGPGWLTVNYAAGKANVSSVDLTPRAVELARAHLAMRNVTADVREGNAENLPFPDNSFDLVVASGVLHHTPDVHMAFRESCRVTRPGGRGKITLYRKGILHHHWIFPLTTAVVRLLNVRHPGADLGRDSSSVDDFIRRYDGDGNPVGYGESDAEWARQLAAAGWTVDGWEIHFFPRRFVPLARFVPTWLHAFLDRHLGTMVYFHLRKPELSGK